MAEMRHPNSLLITSDQHRSDRYGFEGKRNISTPFLNKLSASDTRFSAMSTPNVACRLSLAATFVGLFPMAHCVDVSQALAVVAATGSR